MEFDGEALLWLAVSVIAAFYFSFRFLRHTRLIEDMPTSRVRSAHQGYVELEGSGRLLEGTTITCPLTKTDCLWWFYEIEKRVKRGKNTSWDTIDKKSSDTPFYLEDDTGSCVVNPMGAEVVTTFSRVWHGGSAWPTGLPSDTGFFSSSGYRYTERLIHRGSRLYALGLFRTQNVVMDSAGENAALRDKLAEWKQDPERMQLLDVNRDGQLDIKEWEAARIVALRELQHTRQEVAIEGLHTLSKPDLDNQPFLLSAVLQKDLCRRWRWYAGLCFGWFVIGGALFVWQMIVYGVL